MTISTNTIVGEVVKQNFKTAQLFQDNKIDYCCGGNQSISDACRKVGIDPLQFIEQLDAIINFSDPDTDFINNLQPDELCDYIEKRHHAYVRNALPFLGTNLEKLCNVHGSNHPELFEVWKLFGESVEELTKHMQKEEIMLFPYIRKMVQQTEEIQATGNPTFGSVSNPIEAMISEHETEGRRFDTISKLTDGYNIPSDACTTYRVTFEQLKDFENDLHRHIHLENNILFPTAIKLEAKFVNN